MSQSEDALALALITLHAPSALQPLAKEDRDPSGRERESCGRTRAEASYTLVSSRWQAGSVSTSAVALQPRDERRHTRAQIFSTVATSSERIAAIEGERETAR